MPSLYGVHFWTLIALPESRDSDDNTEAIVGAVVGGIVGMILVTLLLLLILWCYCKQYKKKTKFGAFTHVYTYSTLAMYMCQYIDNTIC